MRSAVGSDAKARLLVIDRDPAVSRFLADELDEHLGLSDRIDFAIDGAQASQLLRANRYDVVVLDLSSLSDIATGYEACVARIVKLAGGALVIATSQGMSVSAAVESMRAGAHDYVAKPISGARLAERLEELTLRHGKSHNLAMESLSTSEAPSYQGFVGRSTQMQCVFEQITRIASSAAPVFITGESGTGKELCANALHKQGNRSNGPFITLNCAAIPSELIETELFGFIKGAFSGASEDRKGAAELADGGTLFLDEISELDLSLQTKLLRFLQTGMVTRIGEGQERKVDVRVVCATNRNCMELIAQRRFREDLFYRLHVLPIHLPPLRQRPADILPLARHFLGRFSREENKNFVRLSSETAELFIARDWPGNVRQLQNLIRRIVVMFDGNEVTAAMVQAADIESHAIISMPDPSILRSSAPAQPAMISDNASADEEIMPMWRQEQKIIEQALDHFNGNIAQAAAALEISPSTIYRKRQAWEQMEGAA